MELIQAKFGEAVALAVHRPKAVAAAVAVVVQIRQIQRVSPATLMAQAGQAEWLVILVAVVVRVFKAL
jgi:hypothetical protein